MKNDCVTPGRVGSVTISCARAALTKPSSQKNMSRHCRLDRVIPTKKKPGVECNLLCRVCLVSLFLHGHFFTDLYAASMLTWRRSWPSQLVYSGIFSSFLISSRDFPCAAISLTRFIRRL